MLNAVNCVVASQYVAEEIMAEIAPRGPAVEDIVESVGQLVEAGFERVALVRIGNLEEEFCDVYESELGEALRHLPTLSFAGGKGSSSSVARE